MLQVSFDDGQFAHIHCKDADCGNEWSARDGADLSEHFDVTAIESSRWTIVCRRCGRKYESG